MAITVIKPEDMGYNFGGELGQSTGRGLRKIVDSLVQKKHREVQHHTLLNAGYSPEDISIIQAGLSPQQLQIMQSLTPNQTNQTPENMIASMGQSQGREPNNISSLLGQGQNNQSQSLMGNQQPQIQQSPDSQPKSFAQRFSKSGLPGNGTTTQKQSLIDRSNANYNKNQSKGYEIAQQTTEILDSMEELLNTGKVASGIKGRALPEWLQTDETQLFDKYSNTLAGLLAQQYGVPTGMKIKFSQSQKPNISQNAGTQRELIKRLRQETERPLMMNEIKEQLIAQNGYQQPENLETRVNQLYGQYKKNPTGLNSRQKMTEKRQNQLPDKEQQSAIDESLLGSGLRNAARVATRAGETVIGLPGDIASGILSSSDYIGKKLGNLTGSEELKKSDTSALRNVLPTSENIKKHVTANVEKALPKNYLTPQSEGEKKLDDFTETFASLLSFGGSTSKSISLISRAAKAAGIAGGSELGKWATEEITGSPALGGAVKLGTILLGSMIGGRKQLEKEAHNLYQKVNKITDNPKATIDVSNTIAKETNNVLKGLGGIESPSKELVKKLGGNLINAVSGKKTMPLKELVEADQVLNEIVRSNYQALSENKSSLKRMYDIKNGIEGAIKSTEKKYPEFYKTYTDAKDILRGLHATDTIRKGLENVARGEHFKSPLTTYFILKNPTKLATYSAGSLGAKALTSPYKVIQSLAKSPYIRKHYGDMVKAGAQGKFQIALKELHKVDEELAKEYPNQEKGR
jgi:hypothetical protein